MAPEGRIVGRDRERAKKAGGREWSAKERRGLISTRAGMRDVRGR